MNGWKQTKEGRKPLDAVRQEIIFQIRAGRPFKDIASQYGFTVQYISKLRRLAGLPRRVNPANN